MIINSLFGKVESLMLNNNFEDFHKLVENTKDIEQLIDDEGNTLLHFIAKLTNNHSYQGSISFDGIKFIKCLLDKGADINAKNYKGETVLDLAVKFKNILDTNSLLKSGAITHAIDIKSLEILLDRAVLSLQKLGNEAKYIIPLKFKPTIHNKLKMIDGALESCKNCENNIPNSWIFADEECISTNTDIPTFGEIKRIQEHIKLRKTQLINLKSEISDCFADASLSLLHTIGLKGIDKLITSHLTEFIPNQNMFSIFAVNKGTYAPLQGYIKENSHPSEEQMAEAVGNSVFTDELIY